MHLINWNVILIVTFTLISTGIDSLSKKNLAQLPDQLQRHYTSVSNQSFNVPSYWEHILREFVFKTISPPPPGNNRLYKSLLEAPFYAGPVPVVAKDASSVVLSRGDVYYQPNDRWLFCQQGCKDCDACLEQTHPVVKWVLRRIKRVSSYGSNRHDLQLTIVPQIDGSYHMRTLWPQSYIYVTSQGEQDEYLSDSYRNDRTAYVAVEDDLPGPQKKSSNFWTYTDKDSLPDKQTMDKLDFKGRTKADKEDIASTTVMSEKEEQGNETKNVPVRQPQVKSEKQNSTSTDAVRSRENGRVKHLIPKLILGTDQTGQKHLVHVVPADTPINSSLMNSLISNALSSAGQNKTAYQRILRRIFDSLNSNRRSIETFLEPLTSMGKASQQAEEHQLQETRGGFPGWRQAGFYPVRNKGSHNESSFQKRWPYTINWSKLRSTSNNSEYPYKIINNNDSFVTLNNSFILYPNGGNNFVKDKRDRFKSGLTMLNNTFKNNFQGNNITRKTLISTESIKS
ncbi:uncharacterized protein LOC108631143 [Ceratina calcarata]|uniref:Uncharacterized protein LOC108631143 n=1 Tax=Ceratina calcarata TaxID=156304 RepID=A0AAJ7JCR0_9HYME|nr:uncharacterized protein LOC108631143 [Ceratina calcarata]XP_026674716.1 uncharacterized protein LOC108631143 [Ceratina calcarata]